MSEGMNASWNKYIKIPRQLAGLFGASAQREAAVPLVYYKLKSALPNPLRAFDFYWRSEGALHLEKMQPSAAPDSSEEHPAPAA